jgi:uncharacterized protein YndB with AHSA1/START domain
MPRVTVSRELLAPREDVWEFVSDPHNLARWWPRLAAVHPDRRGFAPGARWALQGDSRPTLLRRPEAVGALLVRTVDAPSRFAFHLTGDRMDVELTLSDAGPKRTTATLSIDGRWLIGLSRALPRQALSGLYALCQTGAE